MGLLNFFRTRSTPGPRASFQSDGPGTLIVSPQQLEEALRHGNLSAAGEAVTPESALRLPTLYGIIRLISAKVGTTPIDIRRRVDERTREDASDDPVWQLICRRPNRWQKPHQFKRMMQAHVLLRGNAYALKVPGVRGTQALIPLHPARVQPKQLDDMSVEYRFARKDGGWTTFHQDEIFHLFGLTLDGFTGVTPLTYARETIGTALAMQRYVGKVLGNGARLSGSFRTDKSLSDKAYDRLKGEVDDFKSGADREGDIIILEEGLSYDKISLSLSDLEWIESTKLSRTDLCMIYGAPPSMVGDNSGSDSNWGTGLEQKESSFVSYGLDDHFVMWEEGITSDLITDPRVYARVNRGALVRGDIKTRNAAYAQALQWGWMCPDEVRSLEDRNPRPDGKGGEFYPPPNTTKDPSQDPTSTGDNQNDPANPPHRG